VAISYQDTQDNLLDRLNEEVVVSSKMYVVLAVIQQRIIENNIYDEVLESLLLNAMQSYELVHTGIPLSKTID
jgi:hypothetical protein